MAPVVGWTQNACNNGLIVNGDSVTMYGLFVEHHEQYQTLWNGNWGRLYFYQSELPYDPPSQSAWSEAPGVNGYASYKVAEHGHQPSGLRAGRLCGVHQLDQHQLLQCHRDADQCQQVNVHDMMDVYIAGNTSGSGTSVINHIINGIGGTVGPSFGTAYANYLWLNPTFAIIAGLRRVEHHVSFPTESWHSYQLQYKNILDGSKLVKSWRPVGGNDTLQTISDSNLATNRFYRIGSF